MVSNYKAVFKGHAFFPASAKEKLFWCEAALKDVCDNLTSQASPDIMMLFLEGASRFAIDM